MPDFMLKGIDQEVVEKVKELARRKNWSINDVMMHALKQGLGLASADMERVHRDIAKLGGTWGSDESAAFHEAMAALKDMEKNDWGVEPK